MRTMPSAEFRRDYATLTEPVIVTANRRTLGTWTPGDPTGGAWSSESVAAMLEAKDDEIKRLKKELAKRQTPDFVAGPGIVANAHRVLDGTAERELRRSRQAAIDATLGKVNRKKERA